MRVERTRVEEMSSLNVPNSSITVGAPSSQRSTLGLRHLPDAPIAASLQERNYKGKSAIYNRGYERYPAVTLIAAQPFICECYARDQ